MKFIFYDLETTGRSAQWDQIIQIAAILTDSSLNVLDSLNETCKLKSYCIPDPEALLVNQIPISNLVKSNLSFYQLILNVHNKFLKWSPATFIGYNSLQFDEEVLRNAFFTSLLDPYLTLKERNQRTDLLNIVRVSNYFYPEIIKSYVNDKGKSSLRLDKIGPINGIDNFKAHDALGDTDATIRIADLIKKKLPDIWETGTSELKKESILNKIKERPFFTLESYFGKNTLFPLCYIGEHPLYKWALCYDLKDDPAIMENMSDTELETYLSSSPKVIRSIKPNKSPIILSIEQVSQYEENYKINKHDISSRFSYLRNNSLLKNRIISFYKKNFSESKKNFSQEDIFAEETIYKNFPSNYDMSIMKKFRNSEWSDRTKLKNKFKDERLVYFANLILYEESPQYLERSIIKKINNNIRQRLLSENEEKWLTVYSAYKKIDDLREQHYENKSKLRILNNLNNYIESIEKKLQNYRI